MRYQDDDDLSNIEDRRGQGGGVRLGVVGTLIVLVLSVLFRRNFFALLSHEGRPQGASSARSVAEEAQAKKIAVFAFNDGQRFWPREVARRGVSYRDARLVLFWDETRSGCGEASATTGPFYCPADEKVYLDLSFFSELATRFRADGEFAQAYVVAHEVGHHVQNILGIEHRMRAEQRRFPERRNELSVRLELQADCFAGIWGHATNDRHLLDPGDMDSGLRAAASIGDDTLQKRAHMRVRPERFTHGTSEQRKKWLLRGLRSGKIEDCDTFAVPNP